MPHRQNIILITLFLLLGQSLLFSGDWPMWRYDSARSAASPYGIPDNISLLWSRQFAPVRPAWPLDPQQRVNFDASYEPVVVGKLMILGSQNDGTLTAYDTDSGEEKWKFFTEGPIRCAPACWKNKIFAGSDDGYLYCLDVESGKLNWKFRGAPKNRPERKQIGNGHLVSFWPVRGGPVVKDRTVCFASGVWAIFGVYIYALDVETGKVKWENPYLNNIANVRIDHELINNEGLSPQGHLVAINDRLLVPSGRSLPAGLNFKTGKLIYYVRGFHSGDSRVTAEGELAFVGKQAVINTFDFREIGSKWSYSGSKAPKGYKKGFGMNHVGNPDKNSMGEAPWIPYKYVKACDASSALDDGVAYGVKSGNFFAYDIKQAKNIDKQHNRYGRKISIWTWEPPLIWELKTGRKGTSRAIIKAGNKIYGGSKNRLFAIGNLKKNPEILWEKPIKGTPTSLMAADDKLFVTTAEGWIHCFGKTDDSITAKIYNKLPVKLKSKEDKWVAKAKAILDHSGIKSGYCLVLGVVDGRVIEELLKQTELHIIAVEKDADKIDKKLLRFTLGIIYRETF